MENHSHIIGLKPSASAPMDLLMGRLLIEAGKLTHRDIEHIIAKQREGNLRFGDTAVQLGLVEEADILRVLSRQFQYPCLHPNDSQLNESLIAASRPFSLQAEALRALRSQLMLRWFGAHHKVLALIGTSDGAGCSSLAANLSIILSQLGQRTLLIDADLRSPKQHILFGQLSGSGISQILSGRITLDEVVVEIDAFPNLSLLCAGSVPPNPQELLSRPAFKVVLEAASERYDIVIVDTSPALASADAQIVAARAAGCLFVTRRHSTRLTEISELKARLITAGVEIVGAVING